jgi:hypothetical protein
VINPRAPTTFQYSIYIYMSLGYHTGAYDSTMPSLCVESRITAQLTFLAVTKTMEGYGVRLFK